MDKKFPIHDITHFPVQKPNCFRIATINCSLSIVASATRRKINVSPLIRDVYKLKSFDCTALLCYLPIMIVNKDSSSMKRGLSAISQPMVWQK